MEFISLKQDWPSKKVANWADKSHPFPQAHISESGDNAYIFAMSKERAIGSWDDTDNSSTSCFQSDIVYFTQYIMDERLSCIFRFGFPVQNITTRSTDDQVGFYGKSLLNGSSNLLVASSRQQDYLNFCHF